jgi:hypothetical protein
LSPDGSCSPLNAAGKFALSLIYYIAGLALYIVERKKCCLCTLNRWYNCICKYFADDFIGFKKPQDVADVIAYLRTLSDSPVPLPTK